MSIRASKSLILRSGAKLIENNRRRGPESRQNSSSPALGKASGAVYSLNDCNTVACRPHDFLSALGGSSLRASRLKAFIAAGKKLITAKFAKANRAKVAKKSGALSQRALLPANPFTTEVTEVLQRNVLRVPSVSLW